LRIQLQRYATAAMTCLAKMPLLLSNQIVKDRSRLFCFQNTRFTGHNLPGWISQTGPC
jgi:hypothetical protein